METEIKKAIDRADAKIQYDSYCKKFWAIRGFWHGFYKQLLKTTNIYRLIVLFNVLRVNQRLDPLIWIPE